MAEKLNLKSTTFQTYKFVLTPVILLVAVVVGAALVYRFASDRISTQRATIAKQQEEINVLAEKLSILSEESGVLDLYLEPAANILPSTNPALVLLFKLKQLAQENSIGLTEIKIGAPSGAEGSHSSMGYNFIAEGSLQSVLAFLAKLREQTPVVAIRSVSIELSGNAVKAEVSAQSYFAALPETLPPIISPIAKLTREELDLLNSFTQTEADSQFNLSPQEGSPDRNPFTL